MLWDKDNINQTVGGIEISSWVNSIECIISSMIPQSHPRLISKAQAGEVSGFFFPYINAPILNNCEENGIS